MKSFDTSGKHFGKLAQELVVIEAGKRLNRLLRQLIDQFSAFFHAEQGRIGALAVLCIRSDGLAEYGSIVPDGKTFETDYEDMHINVLEIRDHRIEKTIVTIRENEMVPAER